MELYSGENWLVAYGILCAEYCSQNDYFNVNKWNEYDWDNSS